jgi:uncharacterized protein (TIGR02466 family)
MLHQVFADWVYEHQDQDFVNYAQSWFDGSADLNWTNELRGLRNQGNLDQIDQLCQTVPDHAFVNFINAHADIFLQQQYNDFSQRSVLIGIWPFAMTETLCHAPHQHDECHFSGTYYVEIPTGSGPIQFHNDTKIQTINPTTGMLLIWPSHMRHSVPKCQFIGIRRAISFDIALAKR